MRGFGTVAQARAVDQRLRRWMVLPLAIVAIVAAFALSAATAQAEGSHERPNGSLEATCTSVTFHFKGFPNLPGNKVHERIGFKQNLTETVIYEGEFEFNGPEGSNTITFPKVPPGAGALDGFAQWNTNGFKGSFDILFAVNCSFPAYTIEKFQRIQGGGGPFTKEPLLATVGDVVEYQILIHNTGNTKLTLEKFEDKRCTGISGPASLEPGETGEFTCSHTVVPADLSAPSYANQATVTGDPPKGQGSPKTKKSNIVKVTFPTKGSRENGELEGSCNQVTIKLKGFPNAPNNTVTEKITVKNQANGIVFSTTVVVKFNGPSEENTVKIFHPPGYAIVDALVSWNTNGFKGSFDIGEEIFCSANPAFSVEKLQKIEGGQEPPTAGKIFGKIGQTIDYEVTAKNEGNVSLGFGSLQDANCEEIAGGPTGLVAPGASTTWTCKHLIAEGDALSGFYFNTAEATETFESKSTTKASNTVEAEIEP
jgi:hypothetical protein